MIQTNGPARPPIRVSCIQFEPEFGAVAANGTGGGTLTLAGSVPNAATNVPFLIDTTGYLGTDASYAAAIASDTAPCSVFTGHSPEMSTFSISPSLPSM